ncbi:hypothetical protein [Streptomyces sp. NPDC003719]
MITRQPISPSTGAPTGPGSAEGAGSSQAGPRALPSGAVRRPSANQSGTPGSPTVSPTGSYACQTLFVSSAQSLIHTQYEVPSLITGRRSGMPVVSPRRSTPCPVVRPPPGRGREAGGMPFVPPVPSASHVRV